MYYMLLLVLLGEGLLRLEALFSLSECTVRCLPKHLCKNTCNYGTCASSFASMYLYTSIH